MLFQLKKRPILYRLVWETFNTVFLFLSMQHRDAVRMAEIEVFLVIVFSLLTGWAPAVSGMGGMAAAGMAAQTFDSGTGDDGVTAAAPLRNRNRLHSFRSSL